MLTSPGAHAFCRELTVPTPPGYDPVVAGCYDPQGPGVHDLYWANLCVGYRLQRNASPLRGIALAEATKVASQAFGSWSHVTCPAGLQPSVSAMDLGPVDCEMSGHNNACCPPQNLIVFRDDGWPYDPLAVAMTTLTSNPTTGEIYNADIELNSQNFDLVVTSSPPMGSVDLPSVLTHEAGRFLGLADSPDTNAVMNSSYRPGLTVLASDDILGICSIYTPGGARTTSSGPLDGGACNPAPQDGGACTPDAGAQDASAQSDTTGTSSSGGCTCGPGARTGLLADAQTAQGVLGPFAAIGAWRFRRRARRRAAR